VIACLPCAAPTWRRPPRRCPGAQRWKALLAIWPIASIFVVVFGGIYGGVFSPTEGAAVGAVATFVAGWRSANWAGPASALSFSAPPRPAPWSS
jgi:C4-dicarboxylate transporter DctM subunit